MPEPGTVHTTAPLTVQLDSSTTEQPAVNMASVSLAVGTRVDVDQVGKQLHIIGTSTSCAGEVIMGVWAVTPAGMLPCDGATYLRSAYPALSAALGGGGSTFTVPNMPDGTFPASGTPGTSGGAATHTLTTTEMPSHTHIQDGHNHTQNAHSHSQNLGGNLYNVAVPVAGGGVVGDQNTSVTASAIASNQATTATNQNTGGGTAFPIVPLFVGLRFVIKT